MDDINFNTYEYTAIAVTKLDTYMINFSDMMKIPHHTREQMENVCRTRKEHMVHRTLKLYQNLKSIKSKLEVDNEN